MAILSQAISNAIFNAEPDSGTYDPIPEGDYIIKADKAEIKDTASGSGQYIKVEYTIVAPKYEGRKVFHNFNISNTNAQAEDIGRRQIKGFLTAAGVGNMRLTDTNQLLGLTALGHIFIEEPKDPKYNPQNRIKSFKAVDSNKPAASVSQPPIAQALPQGDEFSSAFAAPAMSQAPASGKWFD